MLQGGRINPNRPFLKLFQLLSFRSSPNDQNRTFLPIIRPSLSLLRRTMATASTPSPTTTPSTKLTSWDLFRSVGSPRHIMAPMVDASELAWRLLSRTPLPSGESKVPQLCYSPMINAKIFTESFDGASPHTKGAFDLEAGQS
jgi:hypothetical protein